MMRDAFHRLANDLIAGVQGEEVLLCRFGGEDSEFARFNRGEIRQAGSVSAQHFGLELVVGSRHAGAGVTLSGDHDADLARLRSVLAGLRERLPLLPEDPFVNYATEVNSSERKTGGEMPSADDAVAEIRRAAEGRDLVGIYAAGDIHVGHANSLGQRNWFETSNFNFDWSFYHSGDKAVKSTYAGFAWEPEELGRKVERASQQLTALARAPHTIKPGRYRVFLAPAAVGDVMNLLAWGGFGLKALKTRQTPLLRLATGEVALNDAVTIVENTAEGVAPNFQGSGFIRPPAVPLVEGGQHSASLISPRSAREFSVPTNGASAMEMPESLDVAAGGLPDRDVLERLDTGIYVGNVWYLNYSDRPACRTTGMTRFATFWVEGGEIQAPLNVMRFDETVYRMLGDNLVDLTSDRELILDAGTWNGRSTKSGRYPGALVEDFNFTL